MKLTQLLIILLLMAAFASGMIGFYEGLMRTPEYNKNVTDLQSFNQTQRIYNKTWAVYDVINVTSRDAPPSPIDLIGVPLYLITGAYNAGMLFLEMPNLFAAMVSDIVSIVGFPEWFGLILNALLFVIILGGIIYFITGRNV